MIKIGQITDLHARLHLPGSSLKPKRRSRDAAQLFGDAVQKLKDEKVDVIVITGDLLDVPESLLNPNDYYDYHLDELRQQCIKDYQFFKDALDESKIPYMVLPGNHDLYSAFWEVFDEKENEQEIKKYRFIRFCDREVNNQAHRYDRERALMLKSLDDNNPMPQIHLQHFVVHPELNEGYPHSYFDAVDIKNRLVQSGKVKLCISGHYHNGTDLLTLEKTNFATGRSFSEYPHPICTYEMKNDTVVMKNIDLLKQPISKGKPIAFLDRDGVINTLPAYHTGPDLLVLTKKAGKAIANLHQVGYVVVVITSQSCIGYGYVNKETVTSNHEYLCNLLRSEAGDLAQPDLFLFSEGAGKGAVHESYVDDSNAKPSIDLPMEAIELLGAQLEGSFFVGDNIGDIETGNNLSIDSYLVKTGAGLNSLESLSKDNEKSLSYEVVDCLYDLSKKLLT